MRADRCLEYGIVGWEAIATWFYRMKFTPRVFSSDTMRKYRKFGMPVVHQARTTVGRRQPWTTNLLLSAWLATEGRALSLPRWHPFRVRVTGEACVKPGTLRVRRHRDKKRREAMLVQASGTRHAAVCRCPRCVPARSQ